MNNNSIKLFDEKNINTLEIPRSANNQIFVTIEKISGQPDRNEKLIAWSSNEIDVILHFHKLIATQNTQNKYFLLFIGIDISVADFNSLSAKSEFVINLDLLINAYLDSDEMEFHHHAALLETYVRHSIQFEKYIAGIDLNPHQRPAHSLDFDIFF